MAYTNIKGLNVADIHRCNSIDCIFPVLIYQLYMLLLLDCQKGLASVVQSF